MDALRAAEVAFQFSHRHGDEWVPMRREHTATDHDIERQLTHGTVYKCERCDEYVQVEPIVQDEHER